MYSKYLLLLLLPLIVLINSINCETKGAIGLDSLTFDKVFLFEDNHKIDY